MDDITPNPAFTSGSPMLFRCGLSCAFTFLITSTSDILGGCRFLIVKRVLLNMSSFKVYKTDAKMVLNSIAVHTSTYVL